MNIVFINSVSTQVWGGVEKWMRDISAKLEQRGHRCVVVGRPRSLFLKRIESTGIKVVPLRFRSDLDPFTVLFLARLFQRERTDIVCVNLNKELRLGGIAARIVHTPAVVNRKGLPMVHDNWRFRVTYRHLVDRIIVPSNSLKRELTAYNWLEARKIEVVPNGIEAEAISKVRESKFEDRKLKSNIRDLLGFPFEKKIIGSVGRLVGQKGYSYLIEAIPMVRKVISDIVLVLIGDGPQRVQLEKRVEALGLTGSVLFLGEREDAADLIRGMDLFVLPSVFEPFGQVLLEAMVHSVPVVASKVGGIPEIIEDGVEGILVPPEDSVALSNAILHILSFSKIAAKMGMAGRMKVERQFQLQKTVDAVERIFYDTLTEKLGTNLT